MAWRDIPWVVVVAGFAAGCTPELGDMPFACGSGGVCPDGYACASNVCVREGYAPRTRRPMRTSWLNAPEVFWFPSKSGVGASVVVNDTFNEGEHALYEIAVTPDGEVAKPHPLITYQGEETGRSCAVVLLDDGRHGVAFLRFPDVGEEDVELNVYAIEREVPEGTVPAVELVYSIKEPYLGGLEPAYIGAVMAGSAMHVAWTRPAKGGQAQIFRLERQGALWKDVWNGNAVATLPVGIYPLSGDTTLWSRNSGIVLRVGYENFAVSGVDPTGMISPMQEIRESDLPVYAWDEGLLSVRFGEYDISTDSYPVQYVLTDMAGMDSSVPEDAGYLPASAEFSTALPDGNGAAFIAPIFADRSFSEIRIGRRGPMGNIEIVASVLRESEGLVYTARAFQKDGKIYVAWTELDVEGFLDLWISVVDPLKSSSQKPTRRVSRSMRRDVGTHAEILHSWRQ